MFTTWALNSMHWCYHDAASGATVSLACVREEMPGPRIIAASWASDIVFFLGSVPALVGTASGDAISAGVCLALFAVSLVVWVWAFAVAVARSAQGDDIAVGSLFLFEGRVPRRARRHLFGSVGLSLVITAVAASSNPFAVLVPMLSLGLVGLWGARHGDFPRRKDVTPEARPLRPVRSTGQRGGSERRAGGRDRQ